MDTNDRLRKRSSIRTPMIIFASAMTVFYLGLGSYLFLDKSFLPGIPADFRNIFAGLLIIYGLYRGYRIYSDHF